MKKTPILLALSLPLLLGFTILESPRESGVQKNERMVRKPAIVKAPAVQSVVLTWSYPVPMPRPGTVFDIEFRDNMRAGSWAKVGEVAAPPFAYTITGKKSGFFRVISRSTATGGTGTVKLAWDAPLDDDVNRYRVYRGGVSGAYTNFVVVDAPITTVTISNVTARSFFAATSLDVTGGESVYSNEVNYTPVLVDPVYPVSQLTITSL